MSTPARWRQLFSAFLLSPLASISTADDRQIALTSAEYSPYYSEELENYGPVAEIISEAFARSGYEVSISFYPWPRAELYARQGEEYAGMFPPWRTPEREESFLFSEPLFPNVIGFYKRTADRVNFESLEYLSPYSVGIVRGYANPENFEAANITRVRARNDKQNLIMLCNDRIDMALIDRVLAEYVLETGYPQCLGSRVEWMTPALKVNPQHLVISRQAPDARKKIEAFNYGYAILKEEGAVERILSEHGILEAVEDATDTLFP